MPRIPGFKVEKLKSGKTVVVKDVASAEARLDLCTRLRRKHSKKVKVGRKPCA